MKYTTYRVNYRIQGDYGKFDHTEPDVILAFLDFLKSQLAESVTVWATHCFQFGSVEEFQKTAKPLQRERKLA